MKKQVKKLSEILPPFKVHGNDAHFVMVLDAIVPMEVLVDRDVDTLIEIFTSKKEVVAQTIDKIVQDLVDLKLKEQDDKARNSDNAGKGSASGSDEKIH